MHDISRKPCYHITLSLYRLEKSKKLETNQTKICSFILLFVMAYGFLIAKHFSISCLLLFLVCESIQVKLDILYSFSIRLRWCKHALFHCFMFVVFSDWMQNHGAHGCILFASDLVKIMHMRAIKWELELYSHGSCWWCCFFSLFVSYACVCSEITIVKHYDDWSHALLLGPQASFHRWLAAEAHTSKETRGTHSYAYEPIYNICAIYA